MAQARVPMFFAVSRYRRYKYFDVLWWPPFGDPPQNQFFKRLNLQCQCFLISAVDILETNILMWFGGAAPPPPPPPREPPKQTSENQFFDWLKLGN